MAEIVTSRASAGIYPAPADVGRTLNNGNNSLTIPAEYSGLLTSVTYYPKLTTGAAVIREDNGRRFVDSSAAMQAAYSGYYQFTCNRCNSHGIHSPVTTRSGRGLEPCTLR